MILCDECSNWYHFECVGVKAKEAKKIKEYKCPNCLERENSKEEQTSSKVEEIKTIPQEIEVQEVSPVQVKPEISKKPKGKASKVKEIEEKPVEQVVEILTASPSKTIQISKKKKGKEQKKSSQEKEDVPKEPERVNLNVI
jgi:hypothetical protein